MLRSLVGSEMCIRDSRSPGEREAGRAEQGVYHLHRRGGRDQGICDLDRCLLYTSDAADDLLCVDLGGRRIIKKKKRRIHADQ